MVRTLQQPVQCLNETDLIYLKDKLEENAVIVYSRGEGGVSMSSVNINITMYIDESSDCSEIRFIYDQRMMFDADTYRDTLVTEIIEMPLRNETDRNNFVANLANGSSGVFANVTGVSGILAPG